VITSAPTPPTDLELYLAAERFLDALLSSANVDRIGVTRWWDRAKTALETGAATSTSWRQCVAKAARKLQIDMLNEQASATVVELSTQLDDPAVFARFRTLCTRDALTIAAHVRDRRLSRQNTREESA
jgi:hypothetical protein